MSDLIAFLRDRLDEDEARANGLFFACRIPGKLPDFSSRGGPAAEVYWQHFTPDRMLRDVAATRALLALHTSNHSAGVTEACGYCGHLWPCAEVSIAAAVYSDHPDYRAEWAG